MVKYLVAWAVTPLATVFTWSGCNALAGIERAELLPDGDAGADAAAGLARVGEPCASGGDCRTGLCDVGERCGCPPEMVAVTRATVEPAAEYPEHTYCIDATEVTNAAYRKFFLAQPALGDEPACAWKTQLNAGSEDDGVLPVVHVDWCDARAYCAWAGKHLCGRIGGGPADFEPSASLHSEWFVACSGNGDRTYPYGSTYQPTSCVGEGYGAAGPQPAGATATCVAVVPGLLDLSGNVWEIEDACTPDPDGGVSPEQDACRRRGGSWNEGDSCMRCEACSGASIRRSTTSAETGFRCCAG